MHRRANEASAASAPHPTGPAKLWAVALLRPSDQTDAAFVGLATDLSRYGAWDPRRLAFKEGLKSFCQSTAEVAPLGRQVMHLKTYQAFSEHAGGVVAVALTEGDYPARAGYAVVHDTLKNFADQQQKNGYAIAADVLGRCADPREADRIAGLHLQVDETKEVFLDLIQQALSRGQSLHSVLERSQDLGMNAHHFKKTAREVKRSFQCCKLM